MPIVTQMIMIIALSDRLRRLGQRRLVRAVVLIGCLDDRGVGTEGPQGRDPMWSVTCRWSYVSPQLPK